jgi:antitoxin HicB
MRIRNRSYTVIFEPLESGGYSVTVPALPEIVTSGRTLREAREMAQDAIRCVLEGLAKERKPFPRDIATRPRTEKLSVTLKVA